MEAGATTVNLPDTVGYAMPTEFGPLIKRAVDLVGSSAVISVHCHDDLGLAVANTLTAIQAGRAPGRGDHQRPRRARRQRRAGGGRDGARDALRARWAATPRASSSEQIAPTSRLVSYLTGFVIQPNKAIVGRNAFAHESGIHQDGVLKNPLNFEIMTPQSVGLAGNRLTVGKLSGRRGLQGKLKDLGFDVDGRRRWTRSTARRSPWRTSRRRSRTRTSWRSSASRPPGTARGPTRRSRSRAGASPAATAAPRRATCRSRLQGTSLTAEGSGNGPVDALFGAVDAAVEPVLGWHPRLVDYEIRAVSGGEDAQGQVHGPGASLVR